jgi:DNA helicase HerA-like ATPase
MKNYRVLPGTERRARQIVLGDDQSPMKMYIGRLAEFGPTKDVYMDVNDEHVVAVVGKRGSGKTHTLGVLVEELYMRDSARRNRAILIFDTLNLFQWMGIPLESAKGSEAVRQLKEARSWKLDPTEIKPVLWHLAGSAQAVMQSNPFRIRVADMTPQDWGILMDVDTILEPMGQLLSAVHDKTTRIGWESRQAKYNGSSNASISDLVKCLTEDKELMTEFAPETIRAVKQRLMSYDRTGLFSTHGTSMSEVLKPGQVSVILLAHAPEDQRNLVSFLLIRRLLDERSSASERMKDSMIKGTINEPREEIPRTWVVIDEAQNIIPARTATRANTELTRFVREGRNYGLSMAISTQQPSAIDNRIMAQVDDLIVHTLTVKQDLDYILKNLKSATPDTIYLGRKSLTLADAVRELDIGQCLISSVDSNQRVLFVKVRPRLTPHGGFEA